jgi:hypothetical protein
MVRTSFSMYFSYSIDCPIYMNHIHLDLLLAMASSMESHLGLWHGNVAHVYLMKVVALFGS